MELSAFDVLMVPIFWGTLLGLVVGWAALTLLNAIERVAVFVGKVARSARARAGALRAEKHRVSRPARRRYRPEVYV
jgi:hypothetical protein